MGKVRWKVGTYADQRFTPEKEGVVDWGSYYAAKTMLDREGNRILWGWIPEARPDSDLIAAGWAGVMSMPRVLSLTAQNELQTEVAPAARNLRGSHTHARGKEIERVRIQDLAAELDLHTQPKADSFTLRFHSDNRDFAVITCSTGPAGRELRIGKLVAPLPGTGVHLHMFFDGSVLEIRANETTFITARIYQIPAGPLSITLEGKLEDAVLDAWPMKPISPNRLTAPLCS
jgi:beta-fructofuranosidase